LSNTLVPELEFGSCGNWETSFSEIFKAPKKGMAILAHTHQMHFIFTVMVFGIAMLDW